MCAWLYWMSRSLRVIWCCGVVLVSPGDWLILIFPYTNNEEASSVILRFILKKERSKAHEDNHVITYAMHIQTHFIICKKKFWMKNIIKYWKYVALISSEVKCPSEGLLLCVCFRVISPWMTFLYFPLLHLSMQAGLQGKFALRKFFHSLNSHETTCPAYFFCVNRINSSSLTFTLSYGWMCKFSCDSTPSLTSGETCSSREVVDSFPITALFTYFTQVPCVSTAFICISPIPLFLIHISLWLIKPLIQDWSVKLKVEAL